MYNVPPFLANAWYTECGFSQEKTLGILPKRKRVRSKTLEVVGSLKQDMAKYNLRIEQKTIFARMSTRLRESIFGTRVHIEDREDVCELFRLYTGKSCISPRNAAKTDRNNILPYYKRYEQQMGQESLLSFILGLQ